MVERVLGAEAVPELQAFTSVEEGVKRRKWGGGTAREHTVGEAKGVEDGCVSK